MLRLSCSHGNRVLYYTRIDFNFLGHLESTYCKGIYVCFTNRFVYGKIKLL